MPNPDVSCLDAFMGLSQKLAIELFTPAFRLGAGTRMTSDFFVLTA